MVVDSTCQRRHCNGYKFEWACASKAVCISIIHWEGVGVDMFGCGEQGMYGTDHAVNIGRGAFV